MVLASSGEGRRRSARMPRQGVLAKAIAVFWKVKKFDGAAAGTAPEAVKPAPSATESEDAQKLALTGAGLEIGIQALPETGPREAIEEARPADTRKPLGGELLDIVEKTLDK